MGDGDLELLLMDADNVGESLYLTEDAYRRGLARPADDLDAVPLYEATAEGLGHGLLGGPAAGVVALGETKFLTVGDLAFGKEALSNPRRPFEGKLHPFDVHDIYSDPWHHEIFHPLHRENVTSE